MTRRGQVVFSLGALAFALSILIIPSARAAQMISPGTTASASLTSTTCPGSGCLIVDVSSLATTGVQVTGTFSGTLQFEQTIDGSTWATWPVLPNGSTTAVTSTTTTGLWSGVSAAKQVRVRFSSRSSGTAVITAISTLAKASGGTPGATGATGPAGPAGADASTPYDVSVFAPGGGEITRVTGTHFLTDIAPSLFVLNYILGSAGGIPNGTTLEIVFAGTGIATISLQGSTGFNDIVGDGGSGKTLTSNNVTGDTVRLVAHDNTWFITKLKGFTVSA